MNKKLSKLLYLVICFSGFLYFNFYCSDLIISNLLRGMRYSNPVFYLNYVKNTGAAFSILQNSTEALIIISVIALVLLFGYIYKHLKTISMKSIFFTALLSAGIAGNLHERIAFGYVRDYIALNFVNFPVFNIADIYINLGVIALIILILQKNTK